MDTPTLVALIGSVASATATVVLVFLTGRYVRLTREMVEEARVSKFPNVYVDVELDEVDVKFLIGNAGESAAIDIRLEVDDSVPWRSIGDHPTGINSIEAVKNGVSYLAPGRVLKFHAGYTEPSVEFFSDSSTIDVSVTFKTETGSVQTRRHTIQLSSYSGILLESFVHPEREVARAIRDAERSRKSGESVATTARQIFRRPCPSCYELISRNATKCPHCLEAVPEEETKIDEASRSGTDQPPSDA